MARQSAPGIPILVTRPQAEGEAFAAALTARFGTRVRPVVAPLLAPRTIVPTLPARDYAAVVFTSAQAVAAVIPLLKQLPTLAWCVGQRTAQAANAAGFDARSANGDAKALLSAIAGDRPQGSILYLRGVDTSCNLLESLSDIGVHADECVVYAQDPQPLDPTALVLLLTPGDMIVPLFSPRTAQLFRSNLPAESRARLHIAAMSVKVAKALGDLSHVRLLIAHRPDATAMLEAVESLLAELAPP